MSNGLVDSYNRYAADAKPEPTAGVTETAPRVLIVDDDPGVLLLMSGILSSSGFAVTEANSGSDAIELCADFEPDLVLLDINMPGMDGISACAAIRKQSKRRFPIVMVTSVDDALSIQNAFDAGATDFILKPINWPLLQHRLETVLTEWKKSAALDDSNRRINLLEKITPELAMVVTRSGVIIEDLRPNPGNRNPNAKQKQQTLDDIFSADIAVRLKHRISGVLKTRQHTRLEFNVTEHATTRSYEAQFLLEGRERVILIVQDVSVVKDTESEVYELAYYDAVTGLPNRNLFERRAEELLADAGLQGNFFGLVCLQFDNLATEDLERKQPMRAIANRLVESLANCGCVVQFGEDQNGECVARLDANQFAVIVKNAQSKIDVAVVYQQIERAFSRKVLLDTGSVTTSPTLGIAMYTSDGKDLGTVLHAADAAMREALKTDRFVCFSSRPTNLKIVDTMDYGAELRRAFEDGQLELHFQPRKCLSSNSITCVEALLRWNHPLRGFVPLDEILQLAKATGLIVTLGDWVLHTACEQASQWAGKPAPKVSVNLSQQEFVRRDLADRVIHALDESGLEPEQLELEITEAALMRTENVVADLERLKTLGIGLVIDDFGTGHTSLTYLMQWPIDALKIDGSFVRNLPDSQKDAAVCEVIITIAHKLGMKAIAEQVETEDQLQFLRSRFCDEFQGFHICQPLPAADIDTFLSQHSRKD